MFASSRATSMFQKKITLFRPYAKDSYCPETGMKSEDLKSCPIAQVCPVGSGLENSLDGCDIGRYSTESISDKNECNICPAGYFCDSFKMSENPVAIDAKCEAGFFCAQGSTSPAPFESQCPPGYYCPDKGLKNATQATPCPVGTFSNLANNTIMLDEACETCLGGYICSEPGLIKPYEPCPVGHYCKPGTSKIVDAIPCPGGRVTANFSNRSFSVIVFFS